MARRLLTPRVRRCGWAQASPEMAAYHDREWGVPVHNDRRHFEFLVLEGAQAGLSWATILRKRGGYRKAFAGFDPERVARFTARDVRRLLGDASIVRSRLKIESAVSNARAFLALQAERGSFDSYLWSFVDGRPIVNRWRSMARVPPRTPLSDRVSRDLVRRGFRFVGSTIVYSPAGGGRGQRPPRRLLPLRRGRSVVWPGSSSARSDRSTIPSAAPRPMIDRGRPRRPWRKGRDATGLE